MLRYKILGHSGLRVSELCLGAMTFGEEFGWGASLDECRAMLDRRFAGVLAQALVDDAAHEVLDFGAVGGLGQRSHVWILREGVRGD